ncbi:hypothetical protein UFOVP1349_12 [uncultured Caudovirales phage]|uniref:VRR-NUC domain containing protein n=1 Tax=uncultured Caudovirales phage TaxID=2100421 RepID=A0A6J5SJ08_9CAUD|nr:hypothetical protein UFOVP925_31 [uncultured Caudovirales phage]CAB4184001.1 hypothetical protein UFOVP1097_18 [uncultured Caudovirales phage]CAB4199778.1 hypothetical protein UFOVP1349_12 [uncultured Caudovirales phage]CAB4214592.1 hypothetical protein UFOVP1456_49 [uncultured Caudovirales phage]
MTALRVPAWYADNIGGKNNLKSRRSFVKKPRANLEHKFQVRLVNELRAMKPAPLFFAIPNAGKMHVRHRVNLISEGLLPGAPDLSFPLPGGRTGYLELKAPKGVLSKNQEKFRDAVIPLGHYWEFAKSFDEAWGVLAGWGVVPSGVGA